MKSTEVSTAVKGLLTKFFSPLKWDKFDTVYIAYPHQCYSEDYELSKPKPNTLEIYLYSLPSAVSADSARTDRFTFGSDGVSLYSGQQDCVTFSGATPKSYSLIEDAEGRKIALRKENRIWVLNDLYHGSDKESGVEKTAGQVLQYLIDNAINPPSPEELRHRMLETIDKQIKSQVSAAKKNIQNQAKNFEAELKTAEARVTQLVEQLSYQNMLLDAMETVKRPQAEDVINHIEHMPYVDTYKFANGNLTVYTKPISIGPLEYGPWEIQLCAGTPTFIHDVKGKQRHPYEYADGHYCMGGFAELYADAILRGEYDKALNLCRLEITNYSTTTKQVSLEEFLSKRMGKNFEKILKDVAGQFQEKVDSVQISKINGNEVTYIGLVQKPNGEKVQTAQKLELTYPRES